MQDIAPLLPPTKLVKNGGIDYLGLEIEADGVTYHLSSEFAGEGEMGAVLDLIELERNRRNSA